MRRAQVPLMIASVVLVVFGVRLALSRTCSTFCQGTKCVSVLPCNRVPLRIVLGVVVAVVGFVVGYVVTKSPASVDAPPASNETPDE